MYFGPLGLKKVGRFTLFLVFQKKKRLLAEKYSAFCEIKTKQFMGSNVPFTVPSQGLRGTRIYATKIYRKNSEWPRISYFFTKFKIFFSFFVSLFYVLHDPADNFSLFWSYFDLFYVRNTHTRNVDASRRFVIQGGLAWANIVGICADVILHVCFGEILTCFTGEPGESDFQ